MTIKATVICDSISPEGIRMTTMEIEYPRFILAELNTHRMLSKNSASSRAIPIKAMHEHIKAAPAMPVHWGKNQPGMQAKEEIPGSDKLRAEYTWRKACYQMIEASQELANLGVHKQLANRITEPWMTMKTVISGTEWANFFYLRNHPDAQPEIKQLAHEMLTAMSNSTPVALQPGEWHVPYVTTYRSPTDNVLYYLGENGETLSITEARMISASCCAQVSYRKNDSSPEKAAKIFDQLINSKPAHASPVEHQATPMSSNPYKHNPQTWEPGVSHLSADGSLWSGNLRGWIQFRKLIPNEAQW